MQSNICDKALHYKKNLEFYYQQKNSISLRLPLIREVITRFAQQISENVQLCYFHGLSSLPRLK